MSRAPWAGLEERVRQGDYLWIVRNARAFPEAGSYAYAIRVLGACAELLIHGKEQDQLQRLDRALPADDPLRKVRQDAIRAVFKPCDGLGSFEQMNTARRSLDAEIRKANDAYEQMSDDATNRLANLDVPKDERQQRLGELLAQEDASTASALKAVLAADGSSFEGDRLSALERIPYRMAWEMVICDLYGACGGRTSWRAHFECALHGQCDYWDTFQRVTLIVPIYMGAPTASYYRRIKDNLLRRNYEAFGLP